MTPEQRRWSRIKRVYGITQEQYNELDRGFCPICLKHWSDTVRPVVDHRHSQIPEETYVRGILCRFCNRFYVGRFRDPGIVFRIADYLQNAPTHMIVPKKKKRKKKKS